MNIKKSTYIIYKVYAWYHTYNEIIQREMLNKKTKVILRNCLLEQFYRIMIIEKYLRNTGKDGLYRRRSDHLSYL